MDTVTAFDAKTKGKLDSLRSIMREYAVLLGLREAEAGALACAIASGSDRPLDERDALARVERAVLDPADRDGSDRTILATWLAAQDSDRDPSRLPKGSPEAAGLPMPSQVLQTVTVQEIAQVFGFAGPARQRSRRNPALRSDT